MTTWDYEKRGLRIAHARHDGAATAVCGVRFGETARTPTSHRFILCKSCLVAGAAPPPRHRMFKT